MKASIITVLVMAVCVSCSKTPSNTSEPSAGADSNLPVVAVVDAPVDGATVNSMLEASGWVLAPDGVRSVSVQLDKTVIPAQIDMPRPDVAQAYPAYRNQNAGWRAMISLTDVTPGQHQLSISAESRTGRAIGVKTLSVNVGR